MTPSRRVLVALAFGFAVAAAVAWRAPVASAPTPVERWQERFPDGRALTPGDAERFRLMRAPERRRDAVLLLAGLAVGAAAVALRPDLARRLGDARVAVLLCGTLALGAWHVGASLAAQLERARAGEWTLGDDNLDAVAGPRADLLRAWRDRIGEDDAVLLVGNDNFLRGVVAWALRPRRLYPVVVPVPPGLSLDEIAASLAPTDLGLPAPRWVVHLSALSAGEADALARIDP